MHRRTRIVLFALASVPAACVAQQAVATLRALKMAPRVGPGGHGFRLVSRDDRFIDRAPDEDVWWLAVFERR